MIQTLAITLAALLALAIIVCLGQGTPFVKTRDLDNDSEHRRDQLVFDRGD